MLKLEQCWAYGVNKDEPCWGRVLASEVAPGDGAYIYYCQGHGHPEDKEPYTPEVKESENNLRKSGQHARVEIPD